jgi:serine/threonine-protein kinase HipA
VETDEDFDYYILKFGDRVRNTAELEQTYYEMALLAGIHMMESRLICVEGTNHFLTKRFDRDASGKLHTQTLAALCPEADSYEELLSVCRKLHLPEVDCREVFRRLVFNVLANNTDDHHKNFSFLMDKKGSWRLSPAYDMTYIFDTGGYLPNKEHCLMIGGKLQDITHEDMISFATECGIRQPESIIRKVVAAISSFRELATKNGVKEEWIGRVESCIKEHLASCGFGQGEASFTFNLDGHEVLNAHVEAAYKGNYHLFAIMDGRELKYIIREGKDEHNVITAKGLTNITEEDMKSLVEKCLIQKVGNN